MAVLPGMRAPAPGFDEPLEMLYACHGRIQDQIATLEKLVPHLARTGCDDAAREAARAVMCYFDSAGAHHHQDEEEDLFPLLRRYAGERGRGDVLAALEDLAREHRAMDGVYAIIRARLAEVAEARSPRLDIEQVAHFAWLYRRHIMREEALAFGFAAEALTGEERAALGARMARRRGGKPK
jgi:hemerythrin-like domain-containing protein